MLCLCWTFFWPLCSYLSQIFFICYFLCLEHPFSYLHSLVLVIFLLLKASSLEKSFLVFSISFILCILDLSLCFHHNTLLFVIIFLICFYSVFPIWISASSGWECLCRSHSFTPSSHHGAWYISSTKKVIGLSWWFSGKESACQCRRCGFDLWVGKIPWRRKQQPTPVFLPGEFHGQRSLVGYSSWSHKS